MPRRNTDVHSALSIIQERERTRSTVLSNPVGHWRAQKGRSDAHTALVSDRSKEDRGEFGAAATMA